MPLLTGRAAVGHLADGAPLLPARHALFLPSALARSRHPRDTLHWNSKARILQQTRSAARTMRPLKAAAALLLFGLLATGSALAAKKVGAECWVERGSWVCVEGDLEQGEGGGQQAEGAAAPGSSGTKACCSRQALGAEERSLQGMHLPSQVPTGTCVQTHAPPFYHASLNACPVPHR